MGSTAWGGEREQAADWEILMSPWYMRKANRWGMESTAWGGEREQAAREREREREVYFTVMEFAYMWVVNKVYRLKFTGTRVDQLQVEELFCLHVLFI